jgi:hypothetical protein
MQVPSCEPLAGRSGRTGAVEVERKSRKDKNKSERITVVCERSETIASVRNVPERNERGRRADADRVKHRLSVATFQNHE